MKAKSKIRRFFTLDHRASDGFTLVELIVVIAILAILAGVGTAGYGAYIKAANRKADVVTVQNIVRAVYTAGNSYAHDIQGEQVSTEGLQVPVGFIILSNEQFTVNGGTATVGSGDYNYILMPSEDDPNTGALEEILKDAYGSDYKSAMKLKSDGWTSTNIPALYANAGKLFDQIKTMSSLLYGVQFLLGDKLSQRYDSGVEVVSNIATIITATYDEEEFVEKWIAANGKGTQYAFELNSKGMEVYTAVRAAYNEAVASYIESHSAATHTTTTYTFADGSWSWGGVVYKKCTTNSGVSESSKTHADSIRNYSESVSVGDLVVSDTVQSSLFATFKQDGSIETYGSDAYGYTKDGEYYKENKGHLADGTQLCQTCAECVANYCSSPEAVEDAKAFYKTMKTLASTSEAALEYAEENRFDQWGYYSDYVTDFSTLYSNLETITDGLESCIVVTVYYDPLTELLSTEVSVDLE